MGATAREGTSFASLRATAHHTQPPHRLVTVAALRQPERLRREQEAGAALALQYWHCSTSTAALQRMVYAGPSWFAETS